MIIGTITIIMFAILVFAILAYIGRLKSEIDTVRDKLTYLDKQIDICINLFAAQKDIDRNVNERMDTLYDMAVTTNKISDIQNERICDLENRLKSKNE